jgi:aspartate/methionine/tyrosine aminotransferase
VLLPALLDLGLEPAGGDASFFLWLRVPDGGDDVAFAEGLLQRGVVVAPGSWLGAGGEGHVRVALVPTVEECREAAAVNGFCREVFKELPMEFAVEAQNLLNVSLEGAVG